MDLLKYFIDPDIKQSDKSEPHVTKNVYNDKVTVNLNACKDKHKVKNEEDYYERFKVNKEDDYGSEMDEDIDEENYYEEKFGSKFEINIGDKDYDDEINRMKILYNDIQLISSNAQVIFIRFNPDKYKGLHDENSFTSLEKKRQDYLYKVIMHFLSQKDIEFPLAKIMLFYDGFDGAPKVESIN